MQHEERKKETGMTLKLVQMKEMHLTQMQTQTPNQSHQLQPPLQLRKGLIYQP